MQDLIGAWGEEIATLLAENGRTQKWLADAVGVHPSTIHRIVTGEVNASDELKWKIAGALKVRMDQLWAWPRVVPPAPTGEAA